jgi:LPXTG-motif cell wall-anchored protein
VASATPVEAVPTVSAGTATDLAPANASPLTAASAAPPNNPPTAGAGSANVGLIVLAVALVGVGGFLLFGRRQKDTK